MGNLRMIAGTSPFLSRWTVSQRKPPRRPATASGAGAGSRNHERGMVLITVGGGRVDVDHLALPASGVGSEE